MLTPAMRATCASPLGENREYIDRAHHPSIPVAASVSRAEQQLPENGLDPARDRVHLGGAIDAPEDAAGAVIGKERSSLPAVDRKPCLDRLRAVVGAMDEFAGAAD